MRTFFKTLYNAFKNQLIHHALKFKHYRDYQIARQMNDLPSNVLDDMGLEGADISRVIHNGSHLKPTQ